MKAAEGGDCYAPFQLAKIYFHGWGGIEQDYIESGHWFRKAADLGHKDALDLLTGIGCAHIIDSTNT